MVEAVVVTTRRRGPGQMLGMGDTSDVLNQLTGGEYRKLTDQLDRLELALKLSIAASLLAGMAALAMVLRRKR